MIPHCQPLPSLSLGPGATLACLAASSVITLALLGGQIGIAHHYDNKVQAALAARQAQQRAMAAAPVDAATARQ
jgi:hypothetical protein